VGGRAVTERLLTARELADYLGLAPATILDKWERGELPGFKFGRGGAVRPRRGPRRRPAGSGWAYEFCQGP
jgi:excisionase family DNA binding protein